MMKKAVLIAVLASPLALGACNGDLYGPEEGTNSPKPTQTEQPNRGPYAGPTNDDDMGEAEPTMIVRARQAPAPTYNPFGFETFVEVTLDNQTGAPVDLVSVAYQGYDAEGNLFEAMELMDDEGNPLSSTLQPGRKVSGVVGFTENFEPSEITVYDIMTNSNVTAKVVR